MFWGLNFFFVKNILILDTKSNHYSYFHYWSWEHTTIKETTEIDFHVFTIAIPSPCCSVFFFMTVPFPSYIYWEVGERKRGGGSAAIQSICELRRITQRSRWQHYRNTNRITKELTGLSVREGELYFADVAEGN